MATPVGSRANALHPCLILVGPAGQHLLADHRLADHVPERNTPPAGRDQSAQITVDHHTGQNSGIQKPAGCKQLCEFSTGRPPVFSSRQQIIGQTAGAGKFQISLARLLRADGGSVGPDNRHLQNDARNRLWSAQARSHSPLGLDGRTSRPKKRFTHAEKGISPRDLAHFAMLSRGNCWLNVEGFRSRFPSQVETCLLLGGDFDCFAHQAREHVRGHLPRNRGQCQKQCAHCGEVAHRRQSSVGPSVSIAPCPPEASLSYAELHSGQGEQARTLALPTNASAGVRNGRTGAGSE